MFPNEGVLEPPGRGDGTVFIVSFTPTEYGKTQVGKLVIQTEEMQWSYEIRGIPPEYKAPEIESPCTVPPLPGTHGRTCRRTGPVAGIAAGCVQE